MNNFKAEAITAIMRRRLYAKGMRRTPLFKAITGVLAVNMTFMGMAPVALAGNLPEMTSGYGPGMTVDGNKLTIDSTAGSSFTWDQGFNIGQGYSVEFNGISVAVNKDTSGNLSSIMGSLFSSGAVYILNPNGILFGSSAVVDVQGLVAAAVGSVGKGPEGDFIFSKLGSGNVVNQGKINAGGFAYLVGKSVENSGSISAKEVALAAFGGTGADSLTIASAGNGAKITFNIPEGAIADGSGGEVISKGEIKGSQEGSIDIHNAGVVNRAMATPITYNGDDVEINIAGANVEIESAAIGKKVTITGTQSVFIGTMAGDDVEVKATDGNVSVTAKDDLTVYNGAKIEAIKDQSDGGDVSLTAENGTITLGGTITANGGAGELTLKSAGEIQQTGGAVTAGELILDAAGQDIKLTSANNDFGKAHGKAANIYLKDANDIEITGIESSGTEVLVNAKKVITISDAVDATGASVVLKSDEDKVNVNATVKAKNLGIESKGNLSIPAAAEVSGNTVLRSNEGKIDLTGQQNPLKVAAYGKTGIDVGTADNLTILGDTIVTAGGVSVNANGLQSGAALKIDAQSLSGESISSVNDVTLNVAGDYTVSSTSAGGKLDLDVGGSAKVSSISGGSIDADVSGAMDASSISAGGLADIYAGGNLRFNTLSAGTLKADAGGIDAGRATVGGKADINSRGSINDNGSQINARSLTMTASGDIGSSGKPINFQTKTIEKISGNNVYLNDTTKNDHVSLGTIEARGDLSLTAKDIGGADGTSGGYSDGNDSKDNLISGRNMALNVGGYLGDASKPIGLRAGGDLTLDGGNMNLNPALLIHLIFNGKLLGGLTYKWPYGFVIDKGVFVAGNQQKIREINRALAFTVNTPELKSTQGVFGEPAFIHQGMAVSDATSMGIVNGLSLNEVNYYGTFADIEYASELRDWSPSVNPHEGPLAKKIEELGEKRSLQPDIKNLADSAK